MKPCIFAFVAILRSLPTIAEDLSQRIAEGESSFRGHRPFTAHQKERFLTLAEQVLNAAKTEGDSRLVGGFIGRHLLRSRSGDLDQQRQNPVIKSICDALFKNEFDSLWAPRVQAFLSAHFLNVLFLPPLLRWEEHVDEETRKIHGTVWQPVLISALEKFHTALLIKGSMGPVELRALSRLILALDVYSIYQEEAVKMLMSLQPLLLKAPAQWKIFARPAFFKEAQTPRTELTTYLRNAKSCLYLLSTKTAGEG